MVNILKILNKNKNKYKFKKNNKIKRITLLYNGHTVYVLTMYVV